MTEAICRIPVTLKIESLSVLELVKRSGYLDSPDALSLDALVGYLRDHSDLIDAWLSYSHDKRTSSGWYMKRIGQDKFEVGFFPGGESRTFADSAQACADFISHELREVGEHAG